MDGGEKSSPPLPAAAKQRRSNKSKRQQRNQDAKPSDIVGASNNAASPDQGPGSTSEKASLGSPSKAAQMAKGKKRRRQKTRDAQRSIAKPPQDLGAAVRGAAGTSSKAAAPLSLLSPTPTPSTCFETTSSMDPRKADSPSSQKKKAGPLDAAPPSGAVSSSAPDTPDSESCETPRELADATTAKPQTEILGENGAKKGASLPSPHDTGPAPTKDKVEQHLVANKPDEFIGEQHSSLLRLERGAPVAQKETSGPSTLRAKLPLIPETPAETSSRVAIARRAPKKPQAQYYNSMLQLASSHHSQPEQHTWDMSRLQAPPRLRHNAVILAAIVLVTFAVLLFWHFLVISPKPRAHYNACISEVCYRHADYFRDSLNYSADPCVDFDAFTCSQWMPNTPFSPSFVLDLSRIHMQGMAELLLHGHPHYNASATAAVFLRKCMDDSEDLNGLQQFREFARGIGIPWPYVRQSPGQTKSLHPLRVVFELSTRWHIRTWFSVMQHPVVTTRESNGAFYLDQTSSPSELLNVVRTLEENNAHEVYYGQFCALYNVTVPGSAELRRLLTIERSILTALDTIRTADRLIISAITASHLGVLTSNVTLEEWVDLVRHFAPNIGAPERFVFYVSNMVIIDAVSEIFTFHEHADIMEHLSWWLTQTYTVLGTSKALHIVAESHEEATRVKPVRCYNIVAEKFAVILFAESAATEFSATEREQMSQLLRYLVGLAEKFARLLPWSEAGLSYVARKLRALELIVWPENFREMESALSVMYADFLEVDGVTEPSFMDYWLHASKIFLAMDDYKMFQFSWLIAEAGTFAQDYWNNRLTVLGAALDEPLYYTNNVDLKAANFGGLYVSFLSRILRILNPSVISADVKGNIADLFTERGVKLYLETDECGSSYGHRVKELIALAAAWSEFERARSQEQASSVLNIQSFHEIRSFTDEQVFFLTYCRSLCTARSSHACNPVLRHLGAFGTAFRCAKSAPMRARDSCGLLQVVNDALENQSWLGSR